MTVEQRFDRGAQPELVERGRAQLGDDRAQVLDLAGRCVDRVAHRSLRRAPDLAAQRRGQQYAQAAESLQRLVVQLARPAAALGVGGRQRAAQAVGLHALRHRHGGGGADGERAQQLLVVLAEHGPVRAAIECRQHAERLAAVDHRHEQRGLRVGHPELAGGRPQPRGDVGDPFGRRCSSTCPEVESAIGTRTPCVSPTWPALARTTSSVRRAA